MQGRSLRLTERWFQRALWLVAIVFAWFLIGIGRLIVGDLPQTTDVPDVMQFLPQPASADIQARIAALDKRGDALRAQREQADLVVRARSSDLAAARSSFATWVATRQATGMAAQNDELLARTHAVDALQAKLLDAQQQVQKLDAEQRALRRDEDAASSVLDGYRADAQARYADAMQTRTLQVFGLRLAFTLPLLLIAAWLLRRHRGSRYWPFVWGFVFFALFAFFVELVPYLPSYGGYVRYAVGVLLTLVIGIWAIRRFQDYLVRQKSIEQQPESQRRHDLGYDLAQARLAKGICPGCERPVDLKDAERNFCMHCGITLFDHCPACQARKSAFGHYCHACGHAAPTVTAPMTTAQPSPH